MSFSQNVLQWYVWSYHSVTSSLSDRSKCLTLHTLAYLFIPTQTRLLRDAFSHAAITVGRLHSRDSCVLPHYVILADMLFADFILYELFCTIIMTTVISCFNLQYVTCRGPLEQQCIRYLTSNVFAADL